MLGTKWQKIWGDVLARKTRTALVSTSIFIGVLGVITLATIRDLIFTELHRSFAEEKLPMIWYWVELDDGVASAEVDDAAVLETIRSYPDVTTVEAMNIASFYWREPEAAGFIASMVRCFSEPWDSQPLTPVTLVEGQYPAPGQQELALSWRMARHYGLKVGDSLVIRITAWLNGDLPAVSDLPEETWTVTAILYHPYLGDPGDYSVYVDPQDYAYITGVEHFWNYLIRLTSFPTARDQWEDLRTFITEETNLTVVGVSLEDPASPEMAEDIESWGDPLMALGLIAMLVSSFLVVTVISTIVLEQKRQIGAMKSMGATRSDNFIMYAGIALVYGFIGVIPAVIVGIPLGYYLTTLIAPLTNLRIVGFGVSYPALAIGVGLGLLMPFLASIIPVFLGTRVRILDAITDYGISTRYGGLVSRLIRLLPVPLFLRQALGNLYHKKGRLTMTGITLTLAVGVFMGIWATFAWIGDILDEMAGTFGYELGICCIDYERYDYDEVQALLEANVDGMEEIYPAATVWFAVFQEAQPQGSLRLYGFDPQVNSIQLAMVDGHWWEEGADESGIVITRPAAVQWNLQVGDPLVVGGPDKQIELDVIGIANYPERAGFLRWQVLDDFFDGTLRRQFWIKFADDDLDGADVDRKIAEIRELFLQNGIQAGYDNQRALEEENAQTLLSISLIFNIASLIMAAVGGVGLLAMLSISVFERQREIGVMRAVGAPSQAIAGQFLTEGVLIGVIAWIVGMPVSYGVARILTEVIPVGDLEFHYALVAPAFGLIGMVIVTLFASLGPSLSAANRRVADILRYQ